MRKCTCCSAPMNEGFCITGGMQYYCSRECMEKNGLSFEDYESMCENDEDTYWTTWYENYPLIEDFKLGLTTYSATQTGDDLLEVDSTCNGWVTAKVNKETFNLFREGKISPLDLNWE